MRKFGGAPEEREDLDIGGILTTYTDFAADSRGGTAGRAAEKRDVRVRLRPTAPRKEVRAPAAPVPA